MSPQHFPGRVFAPHGCRRCRSPPDRHHAARLQQTAQASRTVESLQHGHGPPNGEAENGMRLIKLISRQFYFLVALQA